MHLYLRPYQEAAVNAVYEHLGNKDMNPCVLLPSGTGTLTAEQVSKSFADLNAVWDHMYPIEKYKFIQTVVKNITVFRDKIKIEYNQKALCGLTKE